MRFAVVALALLFPCVASAAEPLTVGKCLEILAGLNALDHYDDPTSGKPRQYKLGALRITVGMTISSLKHVSEAADKARVGLIAEIGGGKPIDPNSPDMIRFGTKYQEMLDKPCDVVPARIKISDLKLGDGAEDNAIPPSVLGALAAILDP